MSVNTGFRELASTVPKRVPISFSGNATLVEAVHARSICVISMALSASAAAGTVTFKSDSNDLGSLQFKATDPPVAFGNNPDGWLQTREGEALKVSNPSALTVTGFLTYVEI